MIQGVHFLYQSACMEVIVHACAKLLFMCTGTCPGMWLFLTQKQSGTCGAVHLLVMSVNSTFNFIHAGTSYFKA